MNLHSRPMIPRSTLLLLLLPCFLVSCEEDPELVRKRDEQRAAITRLEAELAVLEEKLDKAPEDRGAELEQLETQTQSDQAAIAELEKELSDLSAKKRQLEREFAAYKRKYPIQ